MAAKTGLGALIYEAMGRGRDPLTEKHWTPPGVARVTGVTDNAARAWINNAVIPAGDTLAILCGALNINGEAALEAIRQQLRAAQDAGEAIINRPGDETGGAVARRRPKGPKPDAGESSSASAHAKHASRSAKRQKRRGKA